MTMVSIIIPVFNLEDSIGDCLQSLLQQTYSNYEVLIIDDGSIDDSMKVCETIIGNDDRFKIIRKQNGGVSSARNIGIENATGYFITFVDGDDVCHSRMLEVLLNGFRNDRRIILSRCSYAVLGSGQKSFKEYESAFNIVDSVELVNQILLEKAAVGVWGGMFRRDLIGSVRFDQNISFNEDKLFLCQYLLRNHGKVTINTSQLYGYVQNKSSATHSTYSSARLTVIDANEKILIEVAAYAPELKDVALFNLENARFNVLKNMALSKDFPQLKKDFQKIELQVLENNSTINKLTNRMQKKALKCGDKIYVLLVKIFRIFKP